MNTDSTTNGGSFTVSTSGDIDPTAQNLQITNPKRCSRMGCPHFAAPGEDFCRKHRSTLKDLIGTDPTPISQRADSGPSNQKLQRQLDRLEGKLDTLIELLGGDVGGDDE